MLTESPPKEKAPIPEYSFSLQRTKFRGNKQFLDAVGTFFGDKIIKKLPNHIDHIGNNLSVCRKLFGLGTVLGNNPWSNIIKAYCPPTIELTYFSNHVWLPQVNESDPERKTLSICINCGSMVIDGEFYTVTELKENESKKS